MTRSVCMCGHPTDVVACRRCGDRLAELLGDVPALVVELNTTIARLGRSGPGGRRSSETPLPYHTAASDALAHLESVLVGYAAVTAKERSLILDLAPVKVEQRFAGRAVTPIPPPSDKATLAGRWLLNHLSHLKKMDQFPIILDAVFVAHRDAWRACDRPRDRAFAGPCDGTGSINVQPDVDPCGYDLYAELDWPTVTCRTCGYEYDVPLRRQWMLDDLLARLGSARWVSRAVATCGVTVPEATIRKWKQRGRIQPRDWTIGLTGQPQPLYLVSDVITVATGQTIDYGTEEAS